MHDWTRVPAGVFHSFHNTWISELQKTLNAGLLPPAFYALGEQRARNIQPDVLTLHSEDEAESEFTASAGDGETGLMAVAEAPPKVRVTQASAENLVFYLERQRTVVIRHSSGDRVVALVEIVSPANKHSRATLDEFVDKVIAALRDGIHVLVIDPHPPGQHDRSGIHLEIWERLLAGDYEQPEDLPLTLVSYSAGDTIIARVEETRIGKELSDMPLFLKPEHYILVPLESTYMQAWVGVPQRWRRVIEGEA
jgi:hypothetical protein